MITMSLGLSTDTAVLLHFYFQIRFSYARCRPVGGDDEWLVCHKFNCLAFISRFIGWGFKGGKAEIKTTVVDVSFSYDKYNLYSRAFGYYKGI